MINFKNIKYKKLKMLNKNVKNFNKIFNFFIIKKFINIYNKFFNSNNNNNIFWCLFLKITNRDIIIFLKNINVFIFDNISLFFKYKFFIKFLKYLEIPLKIIVFKIFDQNSYLNFIKFDIISSLFLIKFKILKNKLKYKNN